MEDAGSETAAAIRAGLIALTPAPGLHLLLWLVRTQQVRWSLLHPMTTCELTGTSRWTRSDGSKVRQESTGRRLGIRMLFDRNDRRRCSSSSRSQSVFMMHTLYLFVY